MEESQGGTRRWIWVKKLRDAVMLVLGFLTQCWVAAMRVLDYRMESRDETQGGEDQGSSQRAQEFENVFSGPSRLEKGHCCLLPNCAPITEDCFTFTFACKYRDHGGHHSDVVVKVPKTDLGDVSLKAVRNELEVLRQLQGEDDHENVVHCLGGNIGDADEWDLEGLDHIQVEGEKDCIVLEPGVDTLHGLLYENQEFSKACTYRKLIEIFIDVARGLEHVHQSNIVHCNLSLANVLINDKGRAQLAGFHAAVRKRKKHIPWQLCGTFGYIAPELFCSIHNGKGLNISDNIDTFALGVMMLECLTQTHPHEVQKKNYPELWKAIYGCCENYMHQIGKYETSISTDDTIVRESLSKVLDAGSVVKFLPWPDAFWRLLDQGDNVEGMEISLEDASEVVKKLRPSAWNQSRSAIDPWPPELCLLIAECVNFVVEEGKCSVKRPSACQVAGCLEAMCDNECPWLDNLLQWVDLRPWENVLPWAPLIPLPPVPDSAAVTLQGVVGSERVALSQGMDAGSCHLDYPEEKLGDGACGSVVKGVYKDYTGMPHDVAVKLVTKYKDTIQKELKVFEELSPGHPNVVRCFGGSFGDGDWDLEHMKHIEIDGKEDFLVLEYLPRNLHQLLYEDKSFETSCTYKRMITLFIDIAKALEFLHEHEIVHFDLKPRNILIDNWKVANVTDFGESRIRVKDSIMRSVHGTIGYIAPELLDLIKGKCVRVSNNVDIFSLGSIMRECLERKGPVRFTHSFAKTSTSTSQETMTDLEEEAPELWALVHDCCNREQREGQDFVDRPTPSAVVSRLGAMLKAPWARKFVSWVPRGSCIVDPDMIFYRDWQFPGGVYKDNDGLVHDVAITLADHQLWGPEHLKNALLAFDKLGNGHPNVVKCYGGNVSGFDWGLSSMDRIEIDGQENFLVVEFVPKDLSQLLYADRVFQTNCTYKTLIELFIDIARGVQFLHENGDVHCNLGPSTVWIDEHGRAKLTSLFATELSSTPQVAVVRVSESDVVSLGGLMSECLTRTYPEEVVRERGRSAMSTEVASKAERDAPELWALVCDCCNHEQREGQDSVDRPTPVAIVNRSVAMLTAPWVGRLVPWAEPGSCTFNSQMMLEKGQYSFVYRGVYIDDHGEAQNVAIKLVNSVEDAIAALINALLVFDKLGNGHPNVVKCYGGNVSDFDWGLSNLNKIEIDGQENFLVVEFLPQDLSELLHSDRVFLNSDTFKMMIELFIDIARGLQFLHENGVVHGFLNPFGVRIDEHRRAKLIGFGATRFRSMYPITVPPYVRLGYTAPELYVGTPGGSVKRSKGGDIFSLGAIMSCLGPQSTLGTSLRLPAELEDLTAKCSSTEVNDNGLIVRPTADEVVNELEAMLSKPWVDDPVPRQSLSWAEEHIWVVKRPV